MNLVVIEGKVVRRYDGAKHLESRDFDMDAQELTTEQRKEHAEYIRQNGFAGYDLQAEEAAAEAVEDLPGAFAFHRIAEQLENEPPHMSPRVEE